MSVFFKRPFFILFLIIHSHLLRAFTLKSRSSVKLFSFLPSHITFTLQKECRSTTSLLHFSSSCTFFFVSRAKLCFCDFSFLPSSHSLPPLKGTWMGCGTAVVLTGLIGLILYLEQRPMLCCTIKNLAVFGGCRVASPLNQYEPPLKKTDVGSQLQEQICVPKVPCSPV